MGVLSHTFYCNFFRDKAYLSLYRGHRYIEDRCIGVPLYKARIVPCVVPTCHVKYWLETKAKPTNFHWIFDFVTVTEHSDPPPVAFGKLGVIVRIKRWSLLRSNYKFELKALSNDQFY